MDNRVIERLRALGLNDHVLRNESGGYAVILEHGSRVTDLVPGAGMESAALAFGQKRKCRDSPPPFHR